MALTMSDKTSVYKAHFNIADLRQQRNHTEVFTTSLAKHESVHHFVLKLLGFCLFSYDGQARLNHQLNKKSPDVGVQTFDEHYLTWLSVDQPDLQVLQKVAKKVDQLWVLTALESSWLQENQQALLQISNSHLIAIDEPFISALVAHLQRNLSWDITIDEHAISVADSKQFYQTQQFEWH